MSPAHNLRPAVARKLAKAMRELDRAADLIGAACLTNPRFAAWYHESCNTLTEIADILDPPKPPAKPRRAKSCNCSLRTKLVGDGCRVCQPDLWAPKKPPAKRARRKP